MSERAMVDANVLIFAFRLLTDKDGGGAALCLEVQHHRILREQRPAYLAVAVESPRPARPETWRDEIFAGYKATRRASKLMTSSPRR